jgi:hypothetical protein
MTGPPAPKPAYGGGIGVQVVVGWWWWWPSNVDWRDRTAFIRGGRVGQRSEKDLCGTPGGVGVQADVASTFGRRGEANCGDEGVLVTPVAPAIDGVIDGVKRLSRGGRQASKGWVGLVFWVSGFRDGGQYQSMERLYCGLVIGLVLGDGLVGRGRGWVRVLQSRKGDQRSVANTK